jgi:hypothetical protein
MTQVRAALIGVAVAFLSACGGGTADEAETSSAQPARALPACADKSPAVRRPSALPADFPLPPGTRITTARTLNPSQFLLGGVIPADLQDAAGFFDKSLPERGYQVGIGDAEAAEAEAPFTGNGFRGRWRVNEIPDCPALRLTLILIKED